MAREILSAKLDIIFKKIFSENEDMLLSFVASMLEVPPESISDIQLTPQEMPPDDPYGKFSRLDLNMCIDGKLVNVEIQLREESDFRDRVLYYWAILFISGLKKGEHYKDLKPTITINIINFNMFRGDGYHYKVCPVVQETGDVFSDKFVMHFFELKKIGKRPDPNNFQQLWLQLLNAESEEELKMIESTNIPVMKKAVNVIYDISDDAQMREAARLRKKAMLDAASSLYNAKEEGREEGREEGAARERAAMIAKMKAKGFTDEKIKEILDL